MRAERVGQPRRHDEQVAGGRGDDVVPGQDVELTAEDEEQLRSLVVPVWHGAVGSGGERDPVTAQRASSRAAVGQQHVPDGVEALCLVGRTRPRRAPGSPTLTTTVASRVVHTRTGPLRLPEANTGAEARSEPPHDDLIEIGDRPGDLVAFEKLAHPGYHRSCPAKSPCTGAGRWHHNRNRSRLSCP
jgi:hypothetical protein